MITRRNFLKQTAFFATLPAINSFATNISPQKLNYFTGKSICPFCSIGCKTEITKVFAQNTMIVTAINGDKNGQVNMGQLCEKSLNLPFKNNSTATARIKTPLLKMKNGQYDKNGVLTPISWQEAFDMMESSSLSSLRKSGVDGVGAVVSDKLSLYESYSLGKLYKGGFRTNNISNINYETQIVSFANIQSFGIDGSNGAIDDIFATDTLISLGVNFNLNQKIIYDKIVKHKQTNNTNFKFINIVTDSDELIKTADINILIKPNTKSVLLAFLIKESLKILSENDLDKVRDETIFALINSFAQDDDRAEQWEVSYNSFTGAFEKFDIDFVTTLIKNSDEDKGIFQEKLNSLVKIYSDKTKNTISFVESTKEEDFLNTQLLLNSLHILLSKHSKSKNGIINCNSNTISSVASLNSGCSSLRLPSGNFIKYKENRKKAEALWQIPQNTLNSVGSNNYKIVFENIKNGLTNFVWCMGILKNDLKYEDFIDEQTKEKNCFVVSSLSQMCEIPSYVDLVLPSATIFEKESVYENSQREFIFLKQQIVPFGESMSELWQILEFSKRIQLQDVWDEVNISKTHKLQSVLSSLKEFFVDSESSLYNVLFETKRSQNYLIDERRLQNIDFFNTEAFGDKRGVKGGNNLLIYGCNFFLQKYLFDEFRMFGLSLGYDFGTFDFYQNSQNISKKWPILLNRGTNYRFNVNDDIYASKVKQDDKEYIFYGKMGSKQLPFGDNIKITDSLQTELKYRAKIFMIKDF
jgi:nitrate reductase (cytochrome)